MTAIDPIDTEIVKNALSAAAEEMGASVVRSGYSAWIKESADASAGIFDDTGRLVAQSAGTQLMHLLSLRMCLPEVLKDYPVEVIREGDVYLMNDPDRGGVHANDIAVFRPVFIDGTLRFFTATLIHVADIGAVTPGGLPAEATEIYHEGLLLPPVRFHRDGSNDNPVERIIKLNSRTPEAVLGDISALAAGCLVGERRIKELAVRYGAERIISIVEGIFDYTERLTRRAIEALPVSGSGSFRIDDDGIERDRRFEVSVTFTRTESDVLFDFTGTDGQARGAINASRSQAMTGVVYALRCFLENDIPMNEGLLRPISFNLPLGTLVYPHRTAAVNARVITVFAVIDAVIRALTKDRPHDGVASSGLVHVYTGSGIDPDTDTRWLDLGVEFGGVGARAMKDGVDASGCYLIAGRSATRQIEGKEAAIPGLLYERVSLIRDSGGAGTWRGGLGVEVTLRARTDMEVSVRADRIRIPPEGADGGQPGRPGGWIVNRGLESEYELSAKQMGVRLDRGDTLTMLTSGGGGFGHPFERPSPHVLSDVLAGKVSIERAASDYGVVVTEAGDEVDQAATETLRATALNGGPW